MPDRTSHTPGTISWTDLATTDQDAREGVLRRPVRLGVRRAAGRRGRDLLDGEARRPLGGGDLAAAARRDRSGHPAALERLRDRRRRRRRPSAKAGEAGGNVLAGPFDVIDAGRMSVDRRPDRRGRCACGSRARASAPRSSTSRARWRGPTPRRPTPTAAQAFYGALLGWRFEQMSEAPPYWVIFNGERSQRRHDGPAARACRPTGSPTSRSRTSTRRSRQAQEAGGNAVPRPDRRAQRPLRADPGPAGRGVRVLQRTSSTTERAQRRHHRCWRRLGGEEREQRLVELLVRG